MSNDEVEVDSRKFTLVHTLYVSEKANNCSSGAIKLMGVSLSHYLVLIVSGVFLFPISSLTMRLIDPQCF